MLEGKKVLITGVSGQCGRGLAFLLGKKNEVHGVARFSDQRIKEEVEGNGCIAWQMDMGTERPDNLPTDFDIVIHEAVIWEGDDDLALQDQSFHLSCTFVGDLMHANEGATFALVSTRSVYRHDGVEGCREDRTPVAGATTYTMSKIAMTQLARWVGTTFNRPWVELRYALPFAPYVVHGKVDKFLKGEMYGSNAGSIQQRTYIKVLIDQTLRALDYARPEGEIFNCTTTEITTLGEVAQAGARVAGVEVDASALASPDPTDRGHWIDPDKCRRLLGPESISLEEGLRRYLRARRENILTPQDWMFAPEE